MTVLLSIVGVFCTIISDTPVPRRILKEEYSREKGWLIILARARINDHPYTLEEQARGGRNISLSSHHLLYFLLRACLHRGRVRVILPQTLFLPGKDRGMPIHFLGADKSPPP